jgi:FixJ family two-component response regulator
VVDDEPGVRAGLARLLRSAGFAATAYAGGAEFLEDLESTRPECLILDLRMPEMDGFELIDRMARSGWKIPVVVLTSFPSADTRRRACHAGVVSFLEKPAERDALLEAIHGALTSGGRSAPPRNLNDSGPEAHAKESIP